MVWNIQKQSTKTTALWIRRYVKQFGYSATIITGGDTIIKVWNETAVDMIPEKQKPEKNVVAMKENRSK